MSDPLDPLSLFIDLGEANVGFKRWHPVSVVDKGGQLCGQSDLGGVWEWTSTVLEKHEGFMPMELYPGYTGMHLITLISLTIFFLTLSSRFLRREAQHYTWRVVGNPSTFSWTENFVSVISNILARRYRYVHG